MTPTHVSIRLGAVLRKLREEMGWTVEEVGERAGRSKGTISAWENGSRSPKLYEMPLVARAYQISAYELAALIDPCIEDKAGVAS
jgi:transcriptional regulator with XRE-family HTH domain